MSMDDIDWRHSLFLAAGLALLAVAIILIFVIPFLRSQPDMNRGSEWIFISIQMFIAALLLSIGYFNRREGCLTKILLVFTGVVSILAGLLMILSISDVAELQSVKWALIFYTIDDVIIGFMAIRGCI